jgi:hypothetical protein
MYLAGILGLCALLHPPASGRVSDRLLLLASQGAQSQSAQSQQEPAKQDEPKPETPQQDQPKSDTSQSASHETKPAGNPQPTQESPNQPAAASAPASQPAQKKPPAPVKKRKTAHKRRTPAPASQDAKKTVVRHGSTAEPTTQLAPGITEEQAARQRQTTNQLLSSTDAALQKLAGRQLSSDQKETVAQIRKFMEQAKAADADGDPQRSYKLALKAHLLTDALAKQ